MASVKEIILPQPKTKGYGQRGLHHAHIEACHAAQNIHLQAAAIGLDSIPVGVFQDDAAKKRLSLLASPYNILIGN